jgi:hypothetical protein
MSNILNNVQAMDPVRIIAFEHTSREDVQEISKFASKLIKEFRSGIKSQSEASQRHPQTLNLINQQNAATRDVIKIPARPRE